MNPTKQNVYNIITSHYIRGDYKRMIAGFRLSPNNDANEELKKDLEQDVMLILYEYKNHAYLAELEKKGCFNYFVMRVISNLVNLSGSSFKRKIINYELRKNAIEDWREYSTIY